MPLRSYKPTSPGRRFMTRSTFEEITTDSPTSRCSSRKKRISGRNNQGRLTVRHRGGGEKRHYRRIDFKRDKWDVPARLATIEYDPNRSARIGLLHYARRREALHPRAQRPEVGDTVVAGPKAEARVGNALPLRDHPARHARSTTSSSCPARAARSSARAGASAQLLAKEGDNAQVRLPSGEVRRVDMRCMATVGQVGNLDHENQSIGKAGRSRHMGRRPEVRGVVDEPARPSARWWRGQVADRHAAQDAVGPARHGPPHAHATRPPGRLIVRSRHRKS